MSKYLTFISTCFKSHFTYKADYILSIVFNMVFFFIFLAIWKYIYSDSSTGTIATYSLSSTITYYFVTSFIYRINLDDKVWIGPDIWHGDFTNDLVKPWNIIFARTLETFSDMLTMVGLYLPFFFFMYIVAAKYIVLPSLTYLIMFFVTLFFVFLINLWINFTIHAFTFYGGDQEPNVGLINFIVSFLAGGYFPLAFLPAGFLWIKYLPFRFLFDFPANVFLQKISPTDILFSWLQMIGWIFVFFVIFYLVYKNGLKRYTGMGR